MQTTNWWNRKIGQKWPTGWKDTFTAFFYFLAVHIQALRLWSLLLPVWSLQYSVDYFLWETQLQMAVLLLHCCHSGQDLLSLKPAKDSLWIRHDACSNRYCVHCLTRFRTFWSFIVHAFLYGLVLRVALPGLTMYPICQKWIQYYVDQINLIQFSMLFFFYAILCSVLEPDGHHIISHVGNFSKPFLAYFCCDFLTFFPTVCFRASNFLFLDWTKSEYSDS